MNRQYLDSWRIGWRLERGEWIGAGKKFSSKNPAYTLDNSRSHTSDGSNHTPIAKTTRLWNNLSLRNDSLKHTRKHERRREESNQRSKAASLWRTVRPGRADCLRWPSGLSCRVTRTVRTLAADCPAWAADRPLKRTEPPESTREKRSVREDRADRLRGPRTVRYWSSDRPQTGCNENLKQNRIKTKRSKNMKNTRRTGMERTVRPVLANRPWGADRVENARPRRSTPPNHHRISQTVEAIKTRVWGL
jgi:hypothetical protein